MVRRPLSDASAIAFMVVLATPLCAKSWRATSISFSLVLSTIGGKDNKKVQIVGDVGGFFDQSPIGL